jgi:hypothetical protein
MVEDNLLFDCLWIYNGKTRQNKADRWIFQKQPKPKATVITRHNRIVGNALFCR